MCIFLDSLKINDSCKKTRPASVRALISWLFNFLLLLAERLLGFTLLSMAISNTTKSTRRFLFSADKTTFETGAFLSIIKLTYDALMHHETDRYQQYIINYFLTLIEKDYFVFSGKRFRHCVLICLIVSIGFLYWKAPLN